MLWDLSVAWTLQGGTMALVTFTRWKCSRPMGNNDLWIRPLSLSFHTWLLAKPQCSFSPSLERCQRSRVNIKTEAWNSGQKFWKNLFPMILKKNAWMDISVNLCWFGLGCGELLKHAIFCRVPSPVHLNRDSKGAQIEMLEDDPFSPEKNWPSSHLLVWIQQICSFAFVRLIYLGTPSWHIQFIIYSSNMIQLIQTPNKNM